MSCIVKSFSKKIEEKHNLSPEYTEFLYQLFINGNDNLSNFNEKEFDNFINYYKSTQTFAVDNKEIFDKLSNYIKNNTNDGYITFNKATSGIKDYVKTLKQAFGNENVFAWTDRDYKAHIRINQPTLNNNINLQAGSQQTDDLTSNDKLSNALIDLINKTENLQATLVDEKQIDEIIENGDAELASNNNKTDNSTFNNIDKAIESGNWTDEALNELDNLKLEDYDKILQRFSQEELRAGNGSLTQAEIIISRGNAQANSRQTQEDSRARAKRQEEQIETWAKENGLWYNDYSESKDGSLESVIESDGGIFSNDSGSESMVYANSKEHCVVKAIDASHYNGDIQGLLDKLILHNSIFPETSLDLVGFGRDRGGTFRAIVKQKYIEGTNPTTEEITKLANNLGLTKKGGWYYTSDGKRITDLNPKNIIKASNGAMLVIDCDVEFTKEYLNSINNLEFMTAFHTGGVKFDKFDFSFMGTGEGAQVHGWGGYLLFDKKTDYVHYGRLFKNKVTGEHNGYMYDVEIPDDNGHNYLDEKKALTEEDKDRISKALKEKYPQITDKQIKKLFAPIEIGAFGKKESVNHRAILWRLNRLLLDFEPKSQRRKEKIKEFVKQNIPIAEVFIKGGIDASRASKFLHDAGYVGIKFEGTRKFPIDGKPDGFGVVIFNENNMKITKTTHLNDIDFQIQKRELRSASLEDMSQNEYAEWLKDNGKPIGTESDTVYDLLTARKQYRGENFKNRLKYYQENPETVKNLSRFLQDVDAKFLQGIIKIDGVRASSKGAGWNHFIINEDSKHSEETHKGYITLYQDAVLSLTTEEIAEFLKSIQESGFNGQVKFPETGGRMLFSFDNFVIHGQTKEDVDKAMAVAEKYWGDKIEATQRGLDRKGTSHTDVLAKEVEDAIKSGSVERAKERASQQEATSFKGNSSQDSDANPLGKSTPRESQSEKQFKDIKKNTDSIKNVIRKIKNRDVNIDVSSNVNRTLMNIADKLNFKYQGQSSYTKVSLPNGDVATIRLGNHKANGNNFNTDINFSIVIESKIFNNIPSQIQYLEYVCSENNFLNNKNAVVAEIVRGIESIIDEGHFIENSKFFSKQKENNIDNMRLPNGTVYGFTKDGKIYLNKDKVNPNTVIHEYTHLWAEAVMKGNPQLWQNIKDYLNRSDVAKALAQTILSQEEYSYLKNDKDRLASEVLARLSGRANREKLEKAIAESKGTTKSILKKVKDLIEKFWKWVGVNLFDMKEFSSIDEITDRILYDLLNQTDLTDTISTPFSETDIEVSKQKSEKNTNTEENLDNEIKSLENLESDKKINVDENSIFAKIHKWKQIKTLSAKEKQELSDSIVKNFSYFINSIYDDPNSVEMVFGKKLDNKLIKNIIKQIKTGKLSRKQFMNIIGFDNLLKEYKENLLSNITFHKDEISENWDAIIFNGRNILSETEGKIISANGVLSNLNENIYDLYEEKNDNTGDEEEDGEAWQIKNDKRSVSNSLSQEIKTIINLIPIKNSYTKWGGYRFENGDDICNRILEICSSANSYNDMINRLKSKSDIYDWINPLIKKIESSDNLKQLFFKNFKKNFVKRLIFMKSGNRLIPYIINYDEEITRIKRNNFKQYWKDGFESMFFKFKTKQINGTFIGNALKDKIKEIQDNLDEYNFISIGIILNNLGIEINTDVIKNIFKKENEKNKLLHNINSILELLKKTDKGVPYNPIQSIASYATTIFKIIEPYDPVYIESSTVQKGKNYYGYVYPSFINDLFDKFKNLESLSEKDYIASIKELYYDDYLFDKNGEPRNEFLKNLCYDKKFREKIDKVQFLHYDGKEIKDMNAKDLFFVQLNMFNDESDGKDYAKYSCGVFSNKDNIQFMTNKKYKNVEDARPVIYDIFLQELDRIRDVISRAKNKNISKIEFYDINEKQLSKIKNLDKLTSKDFIVLLNSGASFKHLSFLNDLLIDSNNKIGKAIIKYINTGNPNLLLENFNELFREEGEFEYFLTKEYQYLIDNNLLPVDLDGKKNYDPDNVKNFILNNFIAQIQFSQLFQIDLAYNKNAEDTQKRAAAFVAPGLKLDINAQFKDKTGKLVNFSDGIMRTVVIEKQKVISDAINVIERIFNEKAKDFFPNENPKKVNTLASILITRLKKVYQTIDVSDGQSWMSPTGYWKKLGMQGQNTEDIQQMIEKISNGNLNLNDISTILGQPQKPVVYGFQKLNYDDNDFIFKHKSIPTYIKDSEITLLLADAIIRGAKEDAILTGFFELMEESHYTKTQWKDGNLKGQRGDYKNNGIDNITMSSAVKTGLKGTIDLSDKTINDYQVKHNCTKAEAVKNIIKEKIYNKDGSYNQNYVTQISFDNYRIQQEVPPHLRNHKQQLGSQPRILMPIDFDANDSFELDGETISGIDLQEKYFNLCAKYYELARKEVEKRFGLSNDNKKKLINNIIKEAQKQDTQKRFKFIYNRLIKLVKSNIISYKSAFGYLNENELKEAIKNKKKIGGLFTKIYNNNELTENDYSYTEAEKNLILSNILIDQINSDSRYDVELINAVSINPETGKFNVPLNDPINHSRFEQLICSIIKKTFVKQDIDGGPVVQASSYGLSNKLNVRYYKPNSKELLMTKKEFEDIKNFTEFNSYEEYVDDMFTDEYGNKITPIIAYHEIAITIPWNNDIANKLIIKEGKRKGEIMTPEEAIEKGILTEEMLYSIGYRIPTENKSSIYPMKIVEFIPEGIGTCVLLPEEITAITGSDFDIDKTFIMFKSFNNENGLMNENKDINTKEGVNNKLFDIYMSIFHNKKTQFLLHNPQGFEDIRRAQLISNIGKTENNNYTYDELKNKNTDELIEIYDTLNPLSKQNIHTLQTQLTFFEKNMEGSQVLGMFASSNTAHGFCQIHNQFLQKDGSEKMYVDIKNKIKLEGKIFSEDGNRLYIDDIYNQSRTMYISTAMGEFVGAAADIVKDDVLSGFNANPKTVNILTLLIRSGFSFDFTCLFLNQPIIKNILKSQTPFIDLNTYIKDFDTDKNGDVLKDDNGNIVFDENNKFDSSELYEHLNDDIESENYQLYLAYMLRELLNVSNDFLTLSLETRYNSIKNAVGPDNISNIINKERHEKFITDGNFKIKNAQNIVSRNPLLNILYEEQFGERCLLERILGSNTIEYSETFLKALKIAKSFLNKNNFNQKDIEFIKSLMNDFNYYRLTFGNKPFFNQDENSRNEIYNNIREKFLKFKSYCVKNNIDNDFINLLYLDKYHNLCFNAKRMKPEYINHIKFSIEELLKMNDKTVTDFVKDSFLYFLQKQGFDFDPNGDIKIYPEYFKSNVVYNGNTFFGYTSNSKFGIPKDSDYFVFNFIIQFFRNHKEYAPFIRMTKQKNNTYKAGFNSVKISNKEVIVEKNKSGNFYSFERDFNDKEDYIPIFSTFHNLYVYSGKNDNGDLIYKRVYELGNKNLKEYNANEDGKEMNTIASEIKNEIKRMIIIDEGESKKSNDEASDVKSSLNEINNFKKKQKQNDEVQSDFSRNLNSIENVKNAIQKLQGKVPILKEVYDALNNNDKDALSSLINREELKSPFLPMILKKEGIKTNIVTFIKNFIDNKTSDNITKIC